ncbi:pilus assembly protein PilM [Prochlorococcus sp. AH-716-D22]|nr:pilus assembly protein PilM [Prochlorococcus sp. AH-716-D22]
MNSAKTSQKKISEYKIDDIKELFNEVLKKISSKVILIEVGSDFLNIGLAKSQNNKLYIKKVFRQNLPEEALDKSLPTDPVNFGVFLKQVLKENKINTNRVALSLPSDTCYTRLIDIPEGVEEDDSISFLDNPNSGIQIPISLENSDFEINLTNLPKKEIKNKIFNKYFLTSIPKKNVDLILDSINNADLNICSIQMSHMCIANLIKTELDKLNDNDLLISVDLLNEFTQLVIFDRSGPLWIKRLASIKNYPSIEDMKKMNELNSKTSNKSNNQNKSENYHPLSKMDLKVLLREINASFNNFLIENNLNKKGKIILSGRNSQHKNLVEIIGENLKMDVALISPINNYSLKEFSYNPEEINQFSMSRFIGLGLTLIKNNELEDESLNREFIVKDFSFQDDIDGNKKKMTSDKNLVSKNIKIKNKTEAITKSEEKKKELPPLPNIKIKNKTEAITKSEEKKKELPPLPNIKIKNKTEAITKSEEKKKELPPLPNIKIKNKTEAITKSEEKKKELPPLPNLGKSNSEENNKDSGINNKELKKKTNNMENKKNKSFKMDTSFLKND